MGLRTGGAHGRPFESLDLAGSIALQQIQIEASDNVPIREYATLVGDAAF